MTDSPPTVLVVEDEPDVAETHCRWLQDRFDVRVAADGTAALERLDGVDVVLLDRMMPGMSGSEVLAAIRERGIDCRVAMVTAVEPDFDIIEMGFDDYLTKPTSREQLNRTVDELLERGTFDQHLQEYYSLLTKRSRLQAEKSPEELDANEEFASLEARIASLDEALDAYRASMLDDMAFVDTLRTLSGGEGA